MSKAVKPKTTSTKKVGEYCATRLADAPPNDTQAAPKKKAPAAKKPAKKAKKVAKK